MKVLYCIDDENGDYDVKIGHCYPRYGQCPSNKDNYWVDHSKTQTRNRRPTGTYHKYRFIELPYSKYIRLLCE